ncbi:MAG: hypothetical protein WCX65_07565 [bacterium]
MTLKVSKITLLVFALLLFCGGAHWAFAMESQSGGFLVAAADNNQTQKPDNLKDKKDEEARANRSDKENTQQEGEDENYQNIVVDKRETLTIKDNKGNAETPSSFAIDSYSGQVSILRVENNAWEQLLRNGVPLKPGDVVRTEQKSSAVISFNKKSHLVLMPLSDLLIDTTLSPEGETAGVAVMDKGRAWVSINNSRENGQIIVVMKNSIINGSRASLFLESNVQSCVDVFNGNVEVRPRADQSKAIEVDSNKRTMVKTENNEIETVPMSDGYAESDTERSCMFSDKESAGVGATNAGTATSLLYGEIDAQNEEAETDDDYYTVTVTAQAMLVIGDKVSGNIGEKSQTEESREYVEDVDDSGRNAITDARYEEEKTVNNEEKRQTEQEKASAATEESSSSGGEEEYEEIEIGASSSITVGAGAAEAAKDDKKQTVADETEDQSEEALSENDMSDSDIENNDMSIGDSFDEEEKPQKASDNEEAEQTKGSDTAEESSDSNSEDEYEEIEIVASSTLTISNEKAVEEEPKVCTGGPNISKALVSGATLESDEYLTLKSESKCGIKTTLKIAWIAEPKCGNIKGMTLAYGTNKSNFKGGETGVTVAGQFALEVTDTEEREFKIEAVDNAGNSVEFKFTVKVTEPDVLWLPIIKNLKVNQEIVKAGTTYDIDDDGCEPFVLDVEGMAESKCGEITSVKVKAHETELVVDGTDEWTTYMNVKTPQIIPFIVEARDSAGLTSKQFAFSVDYDKTVRQPVVSIDSVGGFDTEESSGEAMELYKNDLASGKLIVAGSAESENCTIKKIEASLNGGSSWNRGEGSNSWTYGFSPREGSYEITARVFDTGDNESEEMSSPIEIYYWNKTIEEIIQMAFEDIARAYQDRDADTIIANTSTSYSSDYDSIENRSKMEMSLNGRFTDISQVYLRYRIQSVVASGRTSGRVMIQWDANPTTSGYSNNATFQFQRERSGWRFVTIDDNKSFLRYTNIADSIDITSEKTILTADSEDTTTITAYVRDSAYNAVKNGTPVTFTTNNGTIEANAVTEDGAATVTYKTSDEVIDASITATSGGASSNIVLHLIREYAPGPPPDGG